MSFSAVILAGGKSSRMGRDKAFLDAGGQTLLARQIAVARAAGAEEIFISGRGDTDYAAFPGRVLHDRLPDAGPLGGVEAALTRAAHPLLLVLAVDLPEIQAALLGELAGHCTSGTGVIPRVQGALEPLAAFYPRAARPLARRLLRRKQFAVCGLAERCCAAGRMREVEMTAAAGQFLNWNSPADRAAVLPDARL